jgi:pimeloyl-ACP methyl ester carboxylesterase
MKRILLSLVAVFVLLGGLTVSQSRADLPAVELEAKYAPKPSQFAEVQGLRVHYRDEGVGPPIVLIHGTSSSLHTWDGWVAELSKSHRVVRLDLPGFGLTGPNKTGDYKISTYVEFLDAFMDSLGIEKGSLGGNSLGGHIAWRFALAHPERVEKLILIDSAAYPLEKVPAIFMLASVPGVNAVLRSVTPRALLEKNVREVYGDPSKVTDELVTRYYELVLREGNRQAFIDRVRSASEPWGEQDLAKVQAPTLVMWGELDRWIPISDGERMAKDVPNARLLRYPGVGHVPMEEIAAQTASDALSFLGSGSEAQSTAAGAYR